MDDELNIVPFLDIVVNLIMFLLMVTTATLAAAQIPNRLPPRAGEVTDASGPSRSVTLTLTRRGAVLADGVGVIGSTCTSYDRSDAVAVPVVGGHIDWLRLRRCAEALHAAAPDARLILTADPTITHADVVHAMDALRGTPSRPLYPNLHIGAGLR